MNTQQQDFEELKRLLALKRHERPSHSLLNHISEGIRDRLEHPLPPERLTWWQHLRSDIDLKACAVGVLVCGLMLYAMLAAIRQAPPSAGPISEDTKTPAPPAAMVVKSAPTLRPIPRPEDIPSSTTPVIAPGPTNAPAVPASHKYWR